ncbi:MAG TPA: hypothetical protein PLK55_02535 [archaeon]|jgi:hypothetical protein|nr:hypothetical protein [archaeon]
MTQKYTEIIQLVHPLFDTFFARDYGIKFRTHQDLLNHINNNKDELIAINTTLKAYKRAINVIKEKRPTALFVMVLPAEEDKFSGKEPVAAYNKVIKQLIEHSKETLGERAVVTDFHPEYAGHTEYIKPALYSKLNKDLKISSFGEYGNACVSAWLGYANEKLIKKGFNVKKKNILFNYSINNTFADREAKPTYLDRKIIRKQELYKKRTVRKSIAK